MPLPCSASSDGNICYGPKIRYGNAIGGSPTYVSSGDTGGITYIQHSGTIHILQWCQQLFPKSSTGTATYNSDDTTVNPLFWCFGYDENHHTYFGKS